VLAFFFRLFRGYFLKSFFHEIHEIDQKELTRSISPFAPAQGGANIGVFDVFDQNYLIQRAFFYFKDQ